MPPADDAHYRQLFLAAPLGHHTLDAEGRIVEVNEAWERTVGRPAADVVGTPFEQLVADSERERFRRRFASCISGEREDGLDTVIVRGDGTALDVFMYGHPLQADADGGPTSHCTLVDVTQRRELERALMESEERYRDLFESLPDPVVVHDGEFAILANAAARARFRVPRDADVAGMRIADFIHPETSPEALNRINRLLQGAVMTQPMELALLRADGAAWHAELATTTIKMAGQRVFQTVFRDLTRRRESEKALRQSERRYRAIIESSPMGMHLCRLEPGGRLVFIGGNPAADAIFGTDHSKFVGSTIEEAFPALRDTEVPEQYRRIAAEGGMWHTQSLEYDDGELVGAFDVYAFQTEPSMVVAAFLDVTEKVRSGRELERYRGSLERMVEQRTRELREVQTDLSAITAVIAQTVGVRDPYTADHQRRVAQLASAIASHMDLSDDEVDLIRVAGELHDIGKLAIPSEILTKPATLSETEYELVKGHVSVAHDILVEVAVRSPIPEYVVQHHERLDGSGYPTGLSGDDILLGARILAVADVVEAMSGHRPYRAALGIPAALHEIQSRRGTLYDSGVVDACVALLQGDFDFVD